MAEEQIYQCLISKPLISIGYIDIGNGVLINGWFIIALVEFVFIFALILATILTENSYKRALNNREPQGSAKPKAH